MAIETVAPDADSAAGGWTTDAGGTTSLFATLDEATASDTDYIRSPIRSAVAPDLIVRLYQTSTLIATWPHTSIGTSYVDAEQTLTAPQLAAISDFNALFLEFDDNAGAIYRVSLANPSGALTTPVKVNYRYKAAAAGVAYQGPGDVVSGATAFWGLRAYTAAYAAGGGPCLDLGLTTNGTSPVTINFTTDGYIDTAAVAAAFAASKTKVMKLYDHVGSNHQVPNFSSDHTFAPRLQANAGPGGNTLAMFFDAQTVSDEDTMISTNNITVAQPYSYLMLAKARSSISGIRAIIGAYPNDAIFVYYRSSTPGISVASGGGEIGRPFSVDTWHAMSIAATNASGGTAAFDIDGSQGGGTGIGTSGWSTDIVVLGGSALAIWDGWICEFGIWPSELDTSEQASLNTNMHTRWGF